MTRIERIDEEIKRETLRFAAITKGAVAMSPKAARLRLRIEQLKKERESAVAAEKRTLRELLPADEGERAEILTALLKLPLIADWLYNETVGLQSLLRRHGIASEMTLSPKVESIRKTAASLAFTLEAVGATKTILDKDDTLIDALNKKLDSYLNTRRKWA